MCNQNSGNFTIGGNTHAPNTAGNCCCPCCRRCPCCGRPYDNWYPYSPYVGPTWSDGSWTATDPNGITYTVTMTTNDG